ncbi:hypothetical protein PINS_up004683 [Pythium insidiosum]|nr:hypothetical protein PINS_up004683 [Pythium insidiosum]
MGLVGVIARPMGGVASLFAMASDGLLHGIGAVDTADTEESSLQPCLLVNEVARVRFKILRDSTVGQLALAHGVWLNPLEVDSFFGSSPNGLRILSTDDCRDERLASLFSSGDDLSSPALVTVAVSQESIFFIAEPARSLALPEVVAKSPLSTVHVVEESLTEPTRFDIGIRSLERDGFVWYRLRLLPDHRRQFSQQLHNFLKH